MSLYLITAFSYLFGGGTILGAFVFGVLEGEGMAWFPIVFGVIWCFLTRQFYLLNRDILS